MKEVRNTIIAWLVMGGWFWLFADACMGTSGWWVLFCIALLWPIKEFLMWLGDGTEKPSSNPEPRHGYHETGE